jgi:hypothetical protein
LDFGESISVNGNVILSSTGREAAAISTFLTNSYTGGGFFLIIFRFGLPSLAAALAFSFFIRSDDFVVGVGIKNSSASAEGLLADSKT